MADSVLGSLLDGAMTLVGGLPLSINAKSVTAQKRKLPGVGERLDTIPLLAVCPDPTPGGSVPFQSAGASGVPTVLVTNRILLVLIASSDRDPITGLDEYAEAAQRIARLFRHPARLAAIVPETLMVAVEEGVWIDPAAYAKGYDFLATRVTVSTVEPAY